MHTTSQEIGVITGLAHQALALDVSLSGPIMSGSSPGAPAMDGSSNPATTEAESASEFAASEEQSPSDTQLENTAPELYLIAHKVRGEPAFDIAHRLRIGDEDGWIIPTSGHRAYPYWICELATLGYKFANDGSVPNLIHAMPPGWPDHYSTSRAPKPLPLAERLGIKPATQRIVRRV